MKGIIYRYRNKINNKVYIGQTTRSYRHQEHLNEAAKGSKCFFHAALRKYGEDGFEYSILHTVEHDNEDFVHLKLNELEKMEIAAHNSFGGGYNMNLGGECADNGLAISLWASSDEGKQRNKERSAAMKAREPFVSKVCKHCGKPFQAKTKKALFCDTACRNAAYVKSKQYAGKYNVQRCCVRCGKEFMASKHSTIRYCGYTCAAYARHGK